MSCFATRDSKLLADRSCGEHAASVPDAAATMKHSVTLNRNGLTTGLKSGYLSASPVDRAAMKASWGTSTRPTIFMRFLPSFCFSSSLRLREMSPP